MKVDFNIIKDTSNKTKVIIFGIIAVLVSLIGLTYSWVANWLIGTSNDMSLTAAMLHLNYRGTSPTILAYLAPGETVEKNFEVTNYNNTTAIYNLSWVSVQNLFNPTSEIIYTVSERTLGEIVSARTAPSSNVNIARNISIGPGETHYLTLTLTFILDEERDQTNNIGNYFVGDITIDQNTQSSLDYTEIYANDVLVRSIPDMSTFKFDDKRSWCTDGTTISFNTENSTFSYTNLTFTTSCKTYFYTSKDFAYIAPTTSVPSPYTAYVSPYEGLYQIEAWGAEGGRNAVNAAYTSSFSILGGKGGYTSGKVYLNANDTIYVYVGGKGSNGISGQIVSGGYNGGGQGDYDHADNESAGAGGGSTDIRLSTSTNTINSRIMVAGGGGGSAYNGAGGYGGGLIAGETTYSTGGTQISGYSFGLGQSGTFVDANVDVGGAGGGYYGGYANSSGSVSTYQTSGAGGSSYISGHTGCVAIASSDLTNNPRTPRTGTGGVSCETGTTENSCSIHYSNKYFKDTKMIDGLGYLWTYQKGIQEKMPNPTGGYYNLGQGHSGNGHAKIKYVPNVATHTMTFDLAGGIQSKDYNDEYYEGYNYYIENPTRYSHHFTGWTVNGIGTRVSNNILTVGVANATLTANWEQAYILTINANGGIYEGDVPDYLRPGEELYVPLPKKPGYTFLGWTISATDESGTSTGSTINNTTFTIGIKNTTLTANWELGHTLTINTNGGIYGGDVPDYLGMGEELYVLTPEKSGYIFQGWTISATDQSGTSTGSTINHPTFTMGTKNTTLTANWLDSNIVYTAPTTANASPYKAVTIASTGWYEIELWGAQGGSSYSGRGGYTSGKIYLTKDEVIYFYVGGLGISSINTYAYNGGGYKQVATYSYTGGGSTDIRCFINSATGKCESNDNLEWNSSLGLNSRIMVAGGGGGSANSTAAYGGNAGGLLGFDGATNSTASWAVGRQGRGGTQILGVSPGGNAGDVLFGIGGVAGYYNGYSSGGGGGGYYGGSGGAFDNNGGGGGSSFISGYAGVNAITEGSILEPRSHTNNTKHYSGKYFVDGVMIPGNQSMTSPSGGTETGHSGSGYARITYLGTSAPSRVNTNLNNVRYIKDCMGNNPTDNNAHWDEIQAIKDGENVAYEKTVIATHDAYSGRPYSRITDGNANAQLHAASVATTAIKCVTVDLENIYNLDELMVLHIATEVWPGLQPDYNNITYVSSDNVNWIEVINIGDVIEHHIGKRVNAYSNDVTY